jgi:hypothetical protein
MSLVRGDAALLSNASRVGPGDALWGGTPFLCRAGGGPETPETEVGPTERREPFATR